MRGSLIAAMLLAAGTLDSVPARADRIALTGDRGFTFVGGMSAGFEAPVGNPLVLGATVTLDASWNGLDLRGTVTPDGVTYTAIGGLDSPAG